MSNNIIIFNTSNDLINQYNNIFNNSDWRQDIVSNNNLEIWRNIKLNIHCWRNKNNTNDSWKCTNNPSNNLIYSYNDD